MALRAPDSYHATDLPAFEASLNGRVIRESDDDYDAARHVHNLAFDRRPALIVRAADASDVARTVILASESGLPLAVRGGGHSPAGHGTVDGGIVLDLADMRGLHIDAERRLAWAQPGLTAGEVTEALAPHGLAVPFGDTASVGIAGLTLGAGIGWLARKHGLTIDHLAGVELVTADGRLVTASPERNPDLFWAVRGGGGNFGVVTRFQFRLVPVGMVYGGALIFPPTHEALRGVADAAAAAPDELTTIGFLMHLPPLPFVPAEHHFKLAYIVGMVHAGDPASAEAAVAPFRALGPVADAVGPMPYPAIYGLTAEAGKPSPGVIRSVFMDELDDDSIEAILRRMRQPSSPMAIAQIRTLGGQVARVADNATAFAHRQASVMVAVINPFQGDPAPHLAWSNALHEELAPRARGVYANFLGDEGEARIREAYPEATYARLAEVKRRYDPANLFRLNQNVRPASAPDEAAEAGAGASAG